MEKWREDTKPKEGPTVTRNTVHATDVIESEGVYTLSVLHVMTLQGPGFKGGVSGEHTGASTRIFNGTDDEAYNKALNEGRALLRRIVNELEQSVREVEIQEAMRRARPADLDDILGRK